MFKPDRAIQSYAEDKLSRSPFAKSLADAILNYKDKPIVISFNPWNYSDQNQLVRQFFRQLSFTLKKADHATFAKQAGGKLEKYARLVEPLSLVPAIGTPALILSEMLVNIGNLSKAWGEQKSEDLNSIKKDLNDLLDKETRKIIVVIDDIDRLNNVEIRQIFQLVKSLGDFHNTVYFLAFDKDVVINALKDVQYNTGQEYLEKVVQVPFEVPLISKQEVETLLQEQLNELISDNGKFDQVRWFNIYHDGFKYFFRNIRDVKRYINSLGFSFYMVKDIVNTTDFLTIIAIQVFLPEVYSGIRENKDIFSGLFDSSTLGGISESQEQTRKRCDEIFNRRGNFSEEALKNIMKMLFPKLESVYGNISYDPYRLGKWRQEGRICNPDIFDVFFRLAISGHDIYPQEMRTILSLANDPGTFSETLLSLNKDGRIIRFLDLLEDYTRGEIPIERIENIITALMDIGDLFPEEEGGLFSPDTSMRLLRIFYQLINRFDSQEKRFNVFKNAIEKATRSLYTIVHEVSTQDQEHNKYDLETKAEREEQGRTVNAVQLDELEKLAMSKIRVWANGSQLSKHKHLVEVLFSWERWGNKEEIEQFISHMIEADNGLINFIASFLSKSVSYGMGFDGKTDRVGKVNWRIDLSYIKRFMDLGKIEPRIRKMASPPNFEELPDRSKLAIKLILDSIDSKQSNTSE